MCGRVRLSSDLSELKIRFSIPEDRPSPNFAPTWNGAPTDKLPVVRLDRDGRRSLDLMRWGLIPYWSKKSRSASRPSMRWRRRSRRSRSSAPVPASDRPARLRQALLVPLGHIYGVSNKVLAMALSELLLAGDAKRPAWVEAGSGMIAVDTLVHNFLHRTGILRELQADHPYGSGCYAPGGCAAIIADMRSLTADLVCSSRTTPQPSTVETVK
jgi:SOS response associated peptidase (SRAP)